MIEHSQDSRVNLILEDIFTKIEILNLSCTLTDFSHRTLSSEELLKYEITAEVSGKLINMLLVKLFSNISQINQYLQECMQKKGLEVKLIFLF